MSLELAKFTEKLVSVSEFSQGKAGKIFNDVADNNREYIVLKNNQPTAVLLSVQEYRSTQEKLAILDKILNKMEDIRLQKEEKHGEDKSDNEILSAEERVLEELEWLAKCAGME